MEEIVCSIENNEVQNHCSKAAFTVVEALLSHPLSGVQSFVKAIDEFTEEDFKRMNNKVQYDGNTHLLMNEKELIVYYSVIYFARVAVNSNAESQFLSAYYQGRDRVFESLRDILNQQVPIISRQLIANLKSNKRFLEITRMIPVE